MLFPHEIYDIFNSEVCIILEIINIVYSSNNTFLQSYSKHFFCIKFNLIIHFIL